MLRPFIIWLAITNLLVLPSCSSLPFGSRAKGEDADDEKVPASVRGATSTLSKVKNEATLAASPTVETFFQGIGATDALDTEESTALKETIGQLATSKEMLDFLETTRRSLHRRPELMYELPMTSKTIQTILDDLKIPYTAGWAKNTHQDIFPGAGGYGIVAHIGTMDEDQPCVILRADMDALPIVEATKGVEDFKSTKPGKMHACGHDGHVTMLLGAAALLKKIENEIVGTVRLVFQPAEEGGAGMKRMVEEGLVELAPKAQHAFGMHVWPT